ncbi:hypothetical protein BDF14DRAFT_1859810 [Spinellus fusiger]|nr:hypothetical protein BDF14DRAFT_1859810 [Spinellus fusiger]
MVILVILMFLFLIPYSFFLLSIHHLRPGLWNRVEYPRQGVKVLTRSGLTGDSFAIHMASSSSTRGGNVYSLLHIRTMSVQCAAIGAYTLKGPLLYLCTHCIKMYV